MAILDTNIQTLETEPLEAADGRVFIDGGWYFDDLGDTQKAVADMVFVMRTSGDEVRNRANLGELDFLLGVLGDRLTDHKGHIVMAVPRSRSTDYEAFQAIARDYEIPHDDESDVVLFIPTDKITALTPNPQFYESGSDVRPVINMRIQTSSDTPIRLYSGEEPGPGRWLQIPVESASLGLLGET